MNKDMQTGNLLDLMFDWSRHTPTPDAASELDHVVDTERGTQGIDKRVARFCPYDAHEFAPIF